MDMSKNDFAILIFSSILFVLGSSIGFTSPENILKMARIIYNLGIDSGYKINFSLYDKTYLFMIIFDKNTVATSLNILLGPFLGLFPMFSLLFNGYLIGGVVSALYKSYGYLYILKGILPHGMFEIPAYIYSSFLGFKLSYKAVKHSFRGVEFTGIYLEYLWREVKIIVPILLIAAFTEAFITSSLLGY